VLRLDAPAFFLSHDVQTHPNKATPKCFWSHIKRAVLRKNLGPPGVDRSQKPRMLTNAERFFPGVCAPGVEIAECFVARGDFHNSKFSPLYMRSRLSCLSVLWSVAHADQPGKHRQWLIEPISLVVKPLQVQKVSSIPTVESNPQESPLPGRVVHAASWEPQLPAPDQSPSSATQHTGGYLPWHLATKRDVVLMRLVQPSPDAIFAPVVFFVWRKMCVNRGDDPNGSTENGYFVVYPALVPVQLRERLVSSDYTSFVCGRVEQCIAYGVQNGCSVRGTCISMPRWSLIWWDEAPWLVRRSGVAFPTNVFTQDAWERIQSRHLFWVEKMIKPAGPSRWDASDIFSSEAGKIGPLAGRREPDRPMHWVIHDGVFTRGVPEWVIKRMIHTRRLLSTYKSAESEVEWPTALDAHAMDSSPAHPGYSRLSLQAVNLLRYRAMDVTYGIETMARAELAAAQTDRWSLEYRLEHRSWNDELRGLYQRSAASRAMSQLLNLPGSLDDLLRTDCANQTDREVVTAVLFFTLVYPNPRFQQLLLKNPCVPRQAGPDARDEGVEESSVLQTEGESDESQSAEALVGRLSVTTKMRVLGLLI
jgi:hypothetical protein